MENGQCTEPRDVLKICKLDRHGQSILIGPGSMLQHIRSPCLWPGAGLLQMCPPLAPQTQFGQRVAVRVWHCMIVPVGKQRIPPCSTVDDAVAPRTGRAGRGRGRAEPHVDHLQPPGRVGRQQHVLHHRQARRAGDGLHAQARRRPTPAGSPLAREWGEGKALPQALTCPRRRRVRCARHPAAQYQPGHSTAVAGLSAARAALVQRVLHRLRTAASCSLDSFSLC